jgi:hypothetical protein
MKLDGFATLYLDRLRGLKRLYRGPEHEDEMVAYLPHCTFDLNPRAASIDTPLHRFPPHRHVDHVHPDAVIAIAAAPELAGIHPRGSTATRSVAAHGGDRLRARTDAREVCREAPQAVGVILEKPRPVHLGRGRRGSATKHHRHDQPGDRLARRDARGGKPVFGGAFPASPNPKGGARPRSG